MRWIIKPFIQMVALFTLIGLKILSPIIRVELCIVAFHRYGHLALEPEIFLGEKEIRDRTVKSKRDFRFGFSGGVSDLRDFKQIIFLYRSGEKFYALYLVGG